MIAHWHITRTAIAHLEEITEKTALQWSYAQAVKYHGLLRDGFQKIADDHTSFNSPHRHKLTEGTGFDLQSY